MNAKSALSNPTGAGQAAGRCETGAAGRGTAGAGSSSPAPAGSPVQASGRPHVWEAANVLPPIPRKPSPFADACDTLRRALDAGTPIEEITLDDSTLPHLPNPPQASWMVSDQIELFVSLGDEVLRLDREQSEHLSWVLNDGLNPDGPPRSDSFVQWALSSEGTLSFRGEWDLIHFDARETDRIAKTLYALLSLSH